MEAIAAKAAPSARKVAVLSALSSIASDVPGLRRVLCRPMIEKGLTEEEAFSALAAIPSVLDTPNTLKRPYEAPADDVVGEKRAAPGPTDEGPDGAGSAPGGGSQSASGWETVGDELMVLNRETGKPGSKRVAAFDMDGCLIDTKSGAKFARNAADWRWKYPEVPTRLQALHAEGARVVIMSNQLGVAKGKQSADGLRSKIDAMCREVGFPMQALLAIDDGICRKPRVGMWRYFSRSCNAGVEPSVEESFYVGDAAGRAKKSKDQPKDHSAGDLKFAVNVGLEFSTPELFFRRDRSPRETEVERCLAEPRATVLNPLKERTGQPVFVDLGSSRLEAPKGRAALAVLVGSPGSGKSYIAKRCMPGFQRVNQDTLKTKAKCIKVAREALEAGRSVVVDATNRDTRTRADWIALAKSTGAEPIAVRMLTDKDMCFHLNAVRGCATSGDPVDRKRSVSSVTIHTFFKRVEEPSTREGFAAVHNAQVAPQPEDLDDEMRELLFKFAVP